MRDIDQIVRDMSVRSVNPIGLIDASAFIVGMKKMAEAGAVPDTTGAVEGPFLVPLEQAVELIAQMVSNEFKTQVYYIFYANMLRGLSHHGLAEEFMEHAQHELEHATYLLRRMSVLSPGGIQIPPYPPPEPMTDPQQIVQQMIVVEQMGLALWKQLHSIMGENPMKYTIEQFLQREEEHQDELWQHVEAMQMAPTPTAESVQDQPPQEEARPAKTEVKVTATEPSAEQKVAAIMDGVLRRKQAAMTPEEALHASISYGHDPKTREVLRHHEGGAVPVGTTADIKTKRNWTIGGALGGGALGGLTTLGATQDPLLGAGGAAAGALLGGVGGRLLGGEQEKHNIVAHLMQLAHKDAPEYRKTLTPKQHAAEDAADAFYAKQASAKDSLMASLALAKKDNNTAEIDRLKGLLHREHNVTFEKKAAIFRREDLQRKATQLREQADAIHKKDQDRKLIAQPDPSSLTSLVRKQADMMLPAGMDSPEAYIEREQQLSAQQAMAEAAHAKTIAMQATQAAQQAQAEAEAAQQQLQQAQMNIEQLSQQAAQESQQSMLATQQAAEAEARAADHSIMKMQLGMSVNQLRQELANLVMRDPVAESAATVSDLAAQGMPATPMQQQQAEQQAAMGQDPNAPSAETQEQQQEAANAQQEAGEQQQQADQSAQKDKEKGDGTSVTVKTSVDAATMVLRPGARAAQTATSTANASAQAAKAAIVPSTLSSIVQKAKPYLPHAAAGVGGAALLGGGALLAHRAMQPKTAGVVDSVGRATGRGLVEGAGEAIVEGVKKHAPLVGLGTVAAGGLALANREGNRRRRREDIASGVHEGFRRWEKNASPADRRLADAILDGGAGDQLGHSLVDIIKRNFPGHAAKHEAKQVINKGIDEVKQNPAALMEKLRPHLPGAAVGAGLGILGTKMLSAPQETAPPAYYVQ